MDHETKSIVKEYLSKGYKERKNAVSLLMEIGKKINKCDPDIQCHQQPTASKIAVFVCTIELEGFRTESAHGSGKKEAKMKAATKLLKTIEADVLNLHNIPSTRLKMNSPKSSTDKNEHPTGVNTVGKLQELSTQMGYSIPEYTLIEESGPPHDKEFIMQAKISGLRPQTGKGNTKKEAKKIAAGKMLEILSNTTTQCSSGRVDTPEVGRVGTPGVGTAEMSSTLSSKNYQRRFVSVDNDEMFDLPEADIDLMRSSLLSTIHANSLLKDATSTIHANSLLKDTVSRVIEGRDMHDTDAVMTLKALADRNGLQVKYFDLDKKGDEIDLCLVHVRIDAKSPIVCQGMGKSRGISHADAARSMLQHLEAIYHL